jgi:hypothetical protein
MTKALYQLLVLGRPDDRSDRIFEHLHTRLSELGLAPGTLQILAESDADRRDVALPAVALFVSYDGASDGSHPALAPLLSDSITIITLVSDLNRVSQDVPECLRHINALAVAPDQNIERVASLVLESFRLLRRERRLFISYRRDDSEGAANQLYDALDAHGFDVFIDTRTVPPAVDFQDELWHRLADTDVVVLLDTKGFRDSRWTTEELARANATNIQILHLLWPEQVEDPSSAFSFFHPLELGDFVGSGVISKEARLETATVSAICDHAEQLRARAIAARHAYLVDSFCDNARDRGFTPSVQPERWISIDLAPGSALAVVPTIGVPNSLGINQTFDAISKAGSGTGGIWVLYDSRGLLASWLSHLEWLDGFLPVRSMRLASVDGALRSIAR